MTLTRIAHRTRFRPYATLPSRTRARSIIVVACSLLSVALFDGSAQSAVTFESAMLGPAGQTQGGWALYGSQPTQYLGWRFEVESPVQVLEVGGHIYDPNRNNVFVALVRLDSDTRLPAHPAPQAFLGSSAVAAPFPSQDIRVALPIALGRGSYGLVFGAGILGSTGNTAAMTGNNTDIPGHASYFGWNGTGWFDNPSSLMARFVVVAVQTCGNGTQDAHEQCDDGNHEDGDGCDMRCDVEPALPTPTPTATASSTATPTQTTTPTPTETATPIVPPPALTDNARKCLAALTSAARGVAKVEHAQLQKCFDRVLKDVAAGKSLDAARAACAKGLEASGSPLGRARAKLATIADAKCESVSPDGIGPPCDADAPTIRAVAVCLIADHAARVEQIVAAEYAHACGLIEAVGLRGAFPTLCAP